MANVVPGGSGDNNDAAMVAAELDLLPPRILTALQDREVTIVACRESVVDFAPRLENEHPTGWKKGDTWKIVPGAYLPDEKAIVVATRLVGGERVVPPFGNGHGSASLAIHEALHGFDYSGSAKVSRSNRFRTAWAADHARLSIDYFKNPDSGPEESFAESGARKFGSAGLSRDVWPTLRDYWSTPQSTSDDLDPATERHQESPIGFGRLLANGRAQLFLTARGDRGEHGHGMILIDPDQMPATALWQRRLREMDTETFFDVPSLDHFRV